MKIVIAGCGIVGTALAANLSASKHNVTVIEKNQQHIEYIQNFLDVLCIVGRATAPDTLAQANVGEADLFIAVTDSDEQNLLACLIAKKLGVGSTIARVRTTQSVKVANMLKNELGLSMAINPELDAAREIFNSLKYKAADQIETLAKGSTEIITCTVKEDSPICCTAIRDLYKSTGTRVLVCGIKKDDMISIPQADTIIEPGDKLSFVGTTRNTLRFLKKIKCDTDPINSAAIIGGSKMAVCLARKLLAIGIPVKIIDRDEKRCKELINLVPEADIVCADGTDANLIEEEEILESSVIAALTDDDATNVMIAFFAAKEAPESRAVIKIKKSDFEDMLYGMNIATICNPKHITVHNIERYVKAMQNSLVKDEVESMYWIMNNRICIIEFAITDGMPHVNEPLKNIHFKKDLLIAAIYRNGRPFTPNGDDMICSGDIVIVATTYDDISKFSEIFI